MDAVNIKALFMMGVSVGLVQGVIIDLLTAQMTGAKKRRLSKLGITLVFLALGYIGLSDVAYVVGMLIGIASSLLYFRFSE